MVRQRLSENNSYFRSTPVKYYENEEKGRLVISEWRLAVAGLVFSLLILISKFFYANSDYFRQKFFEQHLVSYETITEDGQVMFRYAWKTAVKFSRFWLPVLCGFLTSIFTWMMVFLDSNVPGVSPPSPFSPNKNRRQSGPVFHLNYIFAILIGVLVGFYMFWRGVSIEF